MSTSAIQWTDATWNPVTGCSHVSEGCDHCYAETLTRMKAAAGVWEAPDLPWTAENAEANVILHPERLDRPLRWRKPRMVFVNSMSDVFHPRVPTKFIVEMFNVMAAAPQHTFQVLTKRPKRMRNFLRAAKKCEGGWLTHNGEEPLSYGEGGLVLNDKPGWPLPNVWLGTSIESREYIGRADLLREAPAAVRFISAEPLLGPLVPEVADSPDPCDDCGARATRELGGFIYCEECAARHGLDLLNIDWLIAGGESGKDHRPVEAQWVRDLRDACQKIDTAFFFKQWGGRTPKAGGRELDGRTWDEMPEVAK